MKYVPIAAIGIGILFVLGCCILGPLPPPPPASPPPPPPPCEAIVNDLHALWSFERDFAYRHKRLASSIGELGDGTGIGKNGFVLKPSLWRARLDAGDAAIPATYSQTDPSTGKARHSGGYRFGIFPVSTETGERERFSAILVAVPETPSASDVCFVALCGPVKLQNDFSFDLEWPVFQLRAEPTVVDALRQLPPTTLAALEGRLSGGNLHQFVVQRFGGLFYPKAP